VIAELCVEEFRRHPGGLFVNCGPIDAGCIIADGRSRLFSVLGARAEKGVVSDAAGIERQLRVRDVIGELTSAASHRNDLIIGACDYFDRQGNLLQGLWRECRTQRRSDSEYRADAGVAMRRM